MSRNHRRQRSLHEAHPQSLNSTAISTSLVTTVTDYDTYDNTSCHHVDIEHFPSWKFMYFSPTLSSTGTSRNRSPGPVFRLHIAPSSRDHVGNGASVSCRLGSNNSRRENELSESQRRDGACHSLNIWRSIPFS